MSTRERRSTGVSVWEPAVGAGIQMVLLAVLWARVGLGPLGWLAGTASAVGTWALLTSALRRSRARAFGPANRITLARATLVGGVTALVADRLGDGVPVMALVTLAALALALDAVDGQVARRTATVSTLGARFDMEVDAFLILILSIAVTPSIGAWVLMIGAMRYVFAVAACVTPWLRAPLPPSRAKKAVAALQGIVLIVASAGVVPRPSALAAVGLALALLMWSFGRDTLCLWHNRRHRTRGLHCGVRGRAPASRAPHRA